MADRHWFGDGIALYHASAMEAMSVLADASVDSVVTDPPYNLGFMGKRWDASGIAYDPAIWGECLRVLKPGGHLLAFGGTRTYHRLACAIEDAGFEIRDSLHWIYGSGFPKSLDVSKAIDKAAGAEREVTGPAPYRRGRAGQSYSETRRVSYDYQPQPLTAPATEDVARWDGWGTALKPAHEPIVLARKPLAAGTVAANVLGHGTGALNINGCRVGTTRRVPASHSKAATTIGPTGISGKRPESELDPDIGRWPPNILLGEEAAADLDMQTGILKSGSGNYINRSAADQLGNTGAAYGAESRPTGTEMVSYGDSGGASRFFPVFRYQAKARPSERPVIVIDGVKRSHPTVKPLELMRWLVRLVTPPGGVVLDPFAGTGTTGQAARELGMRAILCESLDDDEHPYVRMCRQRLGLGDG